MKPGRSLPALATALALSLAAPGLATAQTAGHEGHSASSLELVLNNGAKWQGDENMVKGMSAIRSAMAANLGAIHGGSLTPEAAGTLAADVQTQVDFMIENCKLDPAVDEQFHGVLAEVVVGTSALEAGEIEPGAVTIVQALNAYGEHFEHPGWQALE